MYDDFKNQYRLLDKWLQNQIDFVNISDDDVEEEEDAGDLSDKNVKRCEDFTKNGLLNIDFFHGNAINDFENFSTDIANSKDYRYFNSIESANRLLNKISNKGKEIEEFVKLADKIGEEDPQAKPVSSMWLIQKQSSRGVFRKRCSENMQQIYRRALMPKCDFNKVGSNFIEITFRHVCFPAKLLHIFRTPFPKNNSGRLLLLIESICFRNIFADNFPHFLTFLVYSYSF